jgi:hypothetical protein
MNEEHYATRIREYWQQRGYEVKTWLALEPGAGYCLRSDMVNGLPRNYRDVNASNLAMEAKP